MNTLQALALQRLQAQGARRPESVEAPQTDGLVREVQQLRQQVEQLSEQLKRALRIVQRLGPRAVAYVKTGTAHGAGEVLEDAEEESSEADDVFDAPDAEEDEEDGEDWEDDGESGPVIDV
jgi:hypothetical protein